ncbi:U32 family peptidase [Mobiluncus mulieris]|uniref:peptidase U32 family protein n=1 Tax=Mobiluncus mulieris TaxID=2052 RepID=UPI00147046C8|nr:U32 family peptidase [Mobiluncus mulieris]MCU9995879.1 U32 family peptidase [Mobiluncus mulieris]NMW80752.1 U32 family peptidase [Mobiluncus mulieris]
MSIPEVLAPAGNLAVLKAAVDFGADAVYCGGKAFGMRSGPKNFTLDDFATALDYAHARGARVYATVNIVPNNEEIEAMNRYMGELAEVGIDALIISDIGVMLAARRIAPRTELHVSTQAGVMNYQTANALYDLGASRVVLAREMTLAQIHELRAKTPADLQIEAFVHGSMCMAFSGRCMISKYLTGRDPNHGDCAQSCRWKYHVVEEKRPGELFGLEEDSRGTYLFNSQDMNLLEHVDQILDAGVTSLKIEGRAKGAYYAAAMSNAYQYALQAWKRQRTAEASGAVGNTAATRSVAGETVFLADDTLGEPVPPRVELPEWVRAEPFKVTHREYSTGFYFPDAPVTESTQRGSYISEWLWLGTVTGWEAGGESGGESGRDCGKTSTEEPPEYADKSAGRVTLISRNKILPGDVVEVLAPHEPPFELEIPATGIRNEAGEPVTEINHPAHAFSLPSNRPIPVGAMLRRRA